jgi:SAM-dependent methyltransferase
VPDGDVNATQREAWDGPAGEHWVAEAERFDGANRGFGEAIVAALGPRPGEQVLDVGCGNGAVALAIARAVLPDGAVTGLDLSGPMLGEARRRAREAGATNVSFVQGDAQVHPLQPGFFDAAVSRFGVMFFDDTVAAFANIGRALRPGGRIVFTCWRELLRNEWLMAPAAAALQHVPMPDLGEPGSPGPFALADGDRLRGMLGDAGFVDVDLEETVQPMRMGSSVDDVIGFFKRSDFAQALVAEVAEHVAAAVWASIHGVLEERMTPEGVMLSGTAWLVTARWPG